MADFNILPTGLKTGTQLPLDAKSRSESENILKSLGIDDQLAFTYEEGLVVRCIQEGTSYIWRSATISEPIPGLLYSNFTYPPGISAGGVLYAGRSFNFFKLDYVTKDQLDKKVDKVTGERLINAAEIVKLESLENVELVNPDWNATSGPSEILNKPTIIDSSGYATKVYVDTGDSLKVTNQNGYSLTKNDLTDSLKADYDAVVTWVSTFGTGASNVTADITDHIANLSNPHSVSKDQIGLSSTDNTSDIDKPVSIAGQEALDLKVDKVEGERLINAIEITKLENTTGTNSGDQDLAGLIHINRSSLDLVIGTNTGDQDLSGKVDKVTGSSLLANTEITRLGTLSNYIHPTSHDPSIITQDLNNRFVTDVEKSIWNSKQATLGYTAENVANKQNNLAVDGTATKYPTVNAVNLALTTKADLVGGLIPANQLPSYVDDVLEFANLATFPATGNIGKIYIALDSDKQYRWTSSAYLQITNGLIASTNDVPEGSNNLYFTAPRILSTVLNGLSNGSSAVISATDSVLLAFGKLQGQLVSRATDNLVVHLNGTETITGIKSFVNANTFFGNNLTHYYLNNSSNNISWKIQDLGPSQGAFKLGTNTVSIEMRESGPRYIKVTDPIESPIAILSNHLVNKSQLDLKADASGSASYIQNGTSQQTASLNITGIGIFGSNVTATNFNLPAAGKLSSGDAYITPEDNIQGARVVTAGGFIVESAGATFNSSVTATSVITNAVSGVKFTSGSNWDINTNATTFNISETNVATALSIEKTTRAVTFSSSVTANGTGETFRSVNDVNSAKSLRFSNSGANVYFGIDDSTGSFFGRGNSSSVIYSPTTNFSVVSPNFSLTNNGAATFASSVTAGGNLTLTSANAIIKGGANADRLIVGNNTTTGYMTFNGSTHPTLPNQVSIIGNSLSFVGTATFNSSVTATSFNGGAVLTGTPTAPTAAVGTNTTQIASTAFVQSVVTTGATTIIKNLTPVTHTGTTSATDLVTISIPANTISPSSVYELNLCASIVSAGGSGCALIAGFGTGVNFVRGVPIGTGAGSIAHVKRNLQFNAGNLIAFSNSGAFYTDFSASQTKSVTTFDTTVNNTLTVALQLSSASDTYQIDYVILKKLD